MNEPTTEQPRAEEHVQQIARSLGDYWGRACVNAWRTVFPKRERRK
ncbi:hypothetical protein [Actinomadura sp. CNU-125]|nr:hypothetical protein [Actinomadura sp. CNU-125]